MPPDFYFRGALAQYWQVTYAEYNRLSPFVNSWAKFVDGCYLARRKPSRSAPPKPDRMLMNGQVKI